MGNHGFHRGFNEGFHGPMFIFIWFIIPVGFCILFYWLGHNAGYKKGQQDAKKQEDKNAKGYESY